MGNRRTKYNNERRYGVATETDHIQGFQDPTLFKPEIFSRFSRSMTHAEVAALMAEPVEESTTALGGLAVALSTQQFDQQLRHLADTGEAAA